MEGLNMREGQNTTCGGVMGAMSQADTCGSRMNAKAVLRQRVASLRMEADRLEALARALPEELPPRADEALWDLLLSKR
jgi:hypothetical protein